MVRAAKWVIRCCLRPPEICTCLRTLPAASARDVPCGQTHSQSPSTPTHSIQRRSATHRKTARNHRQPSKTTKQTCLHAILPRLSCSLSPNHPRSGQLLRFFHFARQPFSFPCCCASHPTATATASATARAPSISIPTCWSHRIASQGKPAPRGRSATIPRPHPIRLLCQRDTVLLCIPASTAPRHPGTSSSTLHNPDTPFGLYLDAPLLHLILSATLLGLSFTSPCLC